MGYTCLILITQITHNCNKFEQISTKYIQIKLFVSTIIVNNLNQIKIYLDRLNLNEESHFPLLCSAIDPHSIWVQIASLNSATDLDIVKQLGAADMR